MISNYLSRKYWITHQLSDIKEVISHFFLLLHIQKIYSNPIVYVLQSIKNTHKYT